MNNVAYQKIDGEVKYLVRGKNRDGVDILSSKSLREHCTELVIEFLQAHIQWEKNRKVGFNEFQMAQEVRPGPGDPEKIICEFFSSNVLYTF